MGLPDTLIFSKEIVIAIHFVAWFLFVWIFVLYRKEKRLKLFFKTKVESMEKMIEPKFQAKRDG
jgi:hypothetical protein